MTTTSPDSEAPIDLEPIKSDLDHAVDRRQPQMRRSMGALAEYVEPLIAEVEALRNDRDSWKTVADSYEADRLEQKGEIEALRERVAELEGVLSTEEILTDEYVGRAKAAEARFAEQATNLTSISILNAGLRTDLKAAEARGAALAGVLEGLLGRLDSHFGGPLRNMDWREQEYARAGLAATPADALERARAVTALIEVADAVIDSGARLRSDPGTHELMLASLCSVMADLAKLDTLGKE